MRSEEVEFVEQNQTNSWWNQKSARGSFLSFEEIQEKGEISREGNSEKKKEKIIFKIRKTTTTKPRRTRNLSTMQSHLRWWWRLHSTTVDNINPRNQSINQSICYLVINSEVKQQAALVTLALYTTTSKSFTGGFPQCNNPDNGSSKVLSTPLNLTPPEPWVVPKSAIPILLLQDPSVFPIKLMSAPVYLGSLTLVDSTLIQAIQSPWSVVGPSPQRPSNPTSPPKQETLVHHLIFVISGVSNQSGLHRQHSLARGGGLVSSKGPTGRMGKTRSYSFMNIPWSPNTHTHTQKREEKNRQTQSPTVQIPHRSGSVVSIRLHKQASPLPWATGGSSIMEISSAIGANEWAATRRRFLCFCVFAWT